MVFVPYPTLPDTQTLRTRALYKDCNEAWNLWQTQAHIVLTQHTPRPYKRSDSQSMTDCGRPAARDVSTSSIVIRYLPPQGSKHTEQ
jgi:hypothetical protein